MKKLKLSQLLFIKSKLKSIYEKYVFGSSQIRAEERVKFQYEHF